jgi:DNA-binding CsgD family transcriptional regulator
MDPRSEAHAAFAGRDWLAAYEAFGRCDPLDAEDLDALAESAHWLGRADEVITTYAEAYRLHVEAGTPRRAALSAFMLAIYHRVGGEPAQSAGWMSRCHRLLADEEEGAEHGYPLYLEVAGLMGSDLEGAVAGARRMQDLGRRFGDDTLAALGVFFEGRALIKQARVPEGLALLDEAMVAALSDQLTPMWTGAIYCGLLDACHELVDLRRASEWTEATRRWCSPLPAASLYPGICRVHWAEILHERGAWDEAEAEALASCRDMAAIDVFVVADGYYRVGEIRRRRGDLAGAEEAYALAHEAGRDPQPGLALLRLAQGRTGVASASISAALAATAGDRLGRVPMLDAQAQIALAGGDVERAGEAAAELGETATVFGSAGLRALAHRCAGAVALARGEAVAALAGLRVAATTWQELDAPYEVAVTRLLIAEAYRRLDDPDAAAREVVTAKACFERLGATADLARLAEADGEVPAGASTAAAGLTAREVEVLRLVATGGTNRDIAGALFLSEKTVARHLSNIFTKLGVASRTAATAFAFSSGLMGATAE